MIPLYKRVDLIEEQLAQFVLDPYLSRQDIVYVLDSPEDEDQLLESASRLHPLYEVPFRVAILKRNSGFANANNAGAQIARADLLLLMNSDVLPDRPGWLERDGRVLRIRRTTSGRWDPSSSTRTTRSSTPASTSIAPRDSRSGRTRTTSRGCTATFRMRTCPAPCRSSQGPA